MPFFCVTRFIDSFPKLVFFNRGSVTFDQTNRLNSNNTKNKCEAGNSRIDHMALGGRAANISKKHPKKEGDDVQTTHTRAC